MEARIIKSWRSSKTLLTAYRYPDGLHLGMMRGVRSEIYSLQPRVKCIMCKEELDVLEDGWYSCSKTPGSYCQECAGKHGDAGYMVDGEMRKDPEEKYIHEPPPRPETFRKIRMYLAVQTMSRKATSPEPVEGPSFKMEAVTVSPNVRFLKGVAQDPKPVPSKAERQSAYRQLMAKIGPDRLPPLETVDRRLAYLQSKGYERDPAYDDI